MNHALLVQLFISLLITFLLWLAFPAVILICIATCGQRSESFSFVPLFFWGMYTWFFWGFFQTLVLAKTRREQWMSPKLILLTATVFHIIILAVIFPLSSPVTAIASALAAGRSVSFWPGYRTDMTIIVTLILQFMLIYAVEALTLSAFSVTAKPKRHTPARIHR